MSSSLVVIAMLMATLTLAGCGRPAAPVGPPLVVATTGMVGDLAREIGGERVRVTALMGEGVDPHLYKASPGDVRLLSDAKLVLYSGLHLEGRMGDLLAGLGKDKPTIAVAETIPAESLRHTEASGEHPDPHVWFDAALWARGIDVTRRALEGLDPARAGEFEARAGAYEGVLRALDEYARGCLASVPEGSRVMVTAHDAFGYFGRAYGVDVLAIQGISTDSEASLRDINHLVDTLTTRKIPAVFVESSVPRKTIDALVEGCAARGHRLTIGGELYSDALGSAGTPEGTYVGAFVHNVEVLTRALGGRVPESRPGVLAEYLAARAGRAGGPG